MPTYILTWNPTRWHWEAIDEFVTATKDGETPEFDWSTGSRKTVKEGDRLFLFRQNTERGLIGSGYACGPSYRKAHWDESRDDQQNCVDVRWDNVLDPSEGLPVATLHAANLGVPWDALFGSGVAVPVESVARLEELWQEHLGTIGRLRHYSPPEVLPNEIGGKYLEGAACRIEVNAYERNPEARRLCVEHYGLNCAVCGFNFGEIYGELGDGFIHVHHLRDLATIGKQYEVDPIADLRPVCPNCHAMLHRKCPALSIERLKSILSGKRQR